VSGTEGATTGAGGGGCPCLGVLPEGTLSGVCACRVTRTGRATLCELLGTLICINGVPKFCGAVTRLRCGVPCFKTKTLILTVHMGAGEKVPVLLYSQVTAGSILLREQHLKDRNCPPDTYIDSFSGSRFNAPLGHYFSKKAIPDFLPLETTLVSTVDDSSLPFPISIRGISVVTPSSVAVVVQTMQ